jgi:hypothetical protein
MNPVAGTNDLATDGEKEKDKIHPGTMQKPLTKNKYHDTFSTRKKKTIKHT